MISHGLALFCDVVKLQIAAFWVVVPARLNCSPLHVFYGARNRLTAVQFLSLPLHFRHQLKLRLTVQPLQTMLLRLHPQKPPLPVWRRKSWELTTRTLMSLNLRKILCWSPSHLRTIISFKPSTNMRYRITWMRGHGQWWNYGNCEKESLPVTVYNMTSVEAQDFFICFAGK